MALRSEPIAAKDVRQGMYVTVTQHPTDGGPENIAARGVVATVEWDGARRFAKIVGRRDVVFSNVDLDDLPAADVVIERRWME